MTDMLEKVKSVLGEKYDIFAMISEGGMGEIYLGTHRALNRQVAIKIIRQQFSQDETVRERFCREAKLAANLSFPGIVDIYDFGSEESFDYIIMQYIKGETLAQKLEREGALSCRQCIDIIMPVARALGHADKHKVVHRDIKPSNIMIEENGRVILTDFGISKDMGDSQLTAADTVIGSPKYMSPEQIRGGEVDGRSDLYALGLVFYEMITGKHPFEGRSISSLFYAQVHEMPDRPEISIKNLPSAAGAVIMKLLSKQPEERYQTGEELFSDLQSCCGDASAAPEMDGDATAIEIVMDDATRMDVAREPVRGPSPSADSPIADSIKAKLMQAVGDKKILLSAVGVLLVFLILVFAFSPEDVPKESETIAETEVPVQTPSALSSPLLPAPAEIKETEFSSEALFPSPSPPTETLLTIHERIIRQFEELGRIARADHLNLWSNQSVFRIGDVVSYSFESKKPCYMVLLNLTSDGELVQIFPNKFHQGAFLQANKTYTVPGEDATISLEVTGPVGTDHLIALTSEMPFDIFQVDFDHQTFALLDRSDSRGGEDVLRNMEALANGGVSQLTYSYAIR